MFFTDGASGAGMEVSGAGASMFSKLSKLRGIRGTGLVTKTGTALDTISESAMGLKTFIKFKMTDD